MLYKTTTRKCGNTIILFVCSAISSCVVKPDDPLKVSRYTPPPQKQDTIGTMSFYNAITGNTTNYYAISVKNTTNNSSQTGEYKFTMTDNSTLQLKYSLSGKPSPGKSYYAADVVNSNSMMVFFKMYPDDYFTNYSPGITKNNAIVVSSAGSKYKISIYDASLTDAYLEYHKLSGTFYISP